MRDGERERRECDEEDRSDEHEQQGDSQAVGSENATVKMDGRVFAVRMDFRVFIIYSYVFSFLHLL